MGNRASRHNNQQGFALTRRIKSLSSVSSRKSGESQRKRSTEIIEPNTVIVPRKPERYDIPDSTEGINRLHVQHYLMRYLWQGNFSSPVQEALEKTGVQVLDLGCGAGTWAEEIAKEFPSAQVTGVDIEKFFPDNHEIKNLKFIEDDFVKGKRLPFDDKTFDFVHMRFLLLDMKADEFENAIKELVRVTKPNGWIELVEFDIQHYSFGPSAKKLTDGLSKYLREKGRDPAIANQLPGFLRKTNRVGDINQHDKSVVLGGSGQVAKLAVDDITRLFAEVKELPKLMGVTEEEYEKLLESYKVEVKDKCTFFKVHRLYTQRNTDVAPAS